MTEQATQGRESNDLRNRLKLAVDLFGNYVRFQNATLGSGRLCTQIHGDGTVEIDGLEGPFDPELFEIDADFVAIPLLGKVN